MADNKLFIGVFLILTTCTNWAAAQDIELANVYVECRPAEHNDTVEYQPFRISFNFRIINKTDSILRIGAYNLTRLNIPLKYGYFEFNSSTKEKFSLYSKDNIRWVYPNDTIELLGELVEEEYGFAFMRQFKSMSEVCDCVMNSKFSYTCIEEDYTNDTDKALFQSQDIIMKNYIINFLIDAEILYFYPVGWADASD